MRNILLFVLMLLPFMVFSQSEDSPCEWPCCDCPQDQVTTYDYQTMQADPCSPIPQNTILAEVGQKYTVQVYALMSPTMLSSEFFAVFNGSLWIGCWGEYNTFHEAQVGAKWIKQNWGDQFCGAFATPIPEGKRYNFIQNPQIE